MLLSDSRSRLALEVCGFTPGGLTMNRKVRLISEILVGLAFAALAGCGGSPPIQGCGANCKSPHVSTWTWVNGSNTVLQAGTFGMQGTASPSNTPGARDFAMSWTDHNGNS